MKIGVATLATDEGIGPLDLARAVEDFGFESLFVGEHSHIPASRQSPYPNDPGADLPRPYYRIMDPFVTLSGVAAVTSSLKIGTSVCLVVERDPIHLAKEVSTLDLLSGGRFIFGVGAGWNLEEMRNHGTDPKTRMSLLAERVKAMKAIWTQEQAEYHGRFVDFDPIYSWPKPVQQPHPPVLVGGNGPTVLDRVLDFGDEWFPVHEHDLSRLADRIAELQDRARQAGRSKIPVTLMLARPRHLAKYAEMGISRCLLDVPVAPKAETLERLGELWAAAREYAIEVGTT